MTDYQSAAKRGKDPHMLRWLQSLFAHPAQSRVTILEVVFYTRRSCHLCDSALPTLKAALSRYHHHLEVRDVDSNPEWTSAYTECVPVVLINGKVRFRGTMNPVLLRRILRAEGTTNGSRLVDGAIPHQEDFPSPAD